TQPKRYTDSVAVESWNATTRSMTPAVATATADQTREAGGAVTVPENNWEEPAATPSPTSRITAAAAAKALTNATCCRAVGTRALSSRRFSHQAKQLPARPASAKQKTCTKRNPSSE